MTTLLPINSTGNNKGSGYGTVKTVPLFCADETVNMYTSRLVLMVPPVAGSEDEP